jgi:S1-C subfamily serine protease
MNKILQCRYNVMKISSVETFANIRGRVKDGCKDVCFCRALGADRSLPAAVEKMDRKLSADGSGVTYRRVSLPQSFSAEETADYVKRYDSVVQSGRLSKACKLSRAEEIGELLEKSLREVLELFNSGRQPNPSIDRNFIVKTLMRLDFVTRDFTAADCIGCVKIVGENAVKAQDYLFYCLLAKIGFDVLLLQTEGDISQAQQAFGLSDSFKIGEFGRCDIPKFVKTAETVQPPKPVQPQRPVQPSRPVQPQKPAPKQTKAPRPSSQRQSEFIPQMGSADSVSTGQSGLPCSGGSPLGTVGSRGATRPQSFSRSGTVSGVRTEKTFEQLAGLASSVVMITVCDRSGRPIGSGSGIMIGRDGFILTNNHVAKGGSIFSVRIEDDDRLYNTTEVIKYNPLLDLAIIRIQRRLEPIPIYNGDKLVRGQRVVAIGSPLGLFNSVSDGIISGFRKINDVDMIQFTAPISHGSSGGAVLNMYGEVIGISTAGIEDGQNINLAVGYEYINGFAGKRY